MALHNAEALSTGLKASVLTNSLDIAHSQFNTEVLGMLSSKRK